MSRVNLSRHHQPPTDLIFTPVKSGGVNVTCLDCGLDQEKVWDEGGIGAFVWEYESDGRGVALWVRATCKGCGRVELFEDSGGDASGYARDPRDYDRKHDTNHRLWLHILSPSP